MNTQHPLKVTLLPLVLIGLNACGGNNSKYQDTTELEQPPHLEIVVNKSESVTTENGEAKPRKGLSNAVKMPNDSELNLIYSLDDSFYLLGKVVKLCNMEIVDRNREKGQLYVVFDPDTAAQSLEESRGLFGFFFVAEQYPPAKYLLTLTETSQGTRVKAEFLEYTDSETTANDAPDNGVAKLVKKLYVTLHDDLALD